MDHNRRKFLKGAGALTASMFLPMQFAMRSAHAAATGNKKLVVLNLHGGNDGLNLAIPTEASQYALYQGYRPTIHIPMADILPFGANASGLDFGLHPSMAALSPYFDKLAVFPAAHTSVGTFNANRSHFYQMDLYGAGLSGTNTTSPDGKGWVGRYFDNRYPVQPVGIIGQDFTSAVHGTFRGDTFLLQLANPANVNLGASTKAAADAIWNDIKDISGADPASYAGRYGINQVTLFDEVLAKLEADVDFTRTANAMYPNNVGTNFKRAADMLIGLPELEVIHISQGGYDTHRKQGAGVDAVNGVGQQASLLKNWADAIAAFYADLDAVDPALRSNVVVTVQTEFGRTIKENGNFGTDHGNASCWMAFGDSVQGGVYGSYAGLEPANLNGGDWLRPTIDYRDIFSEVIASHLGYTNPNSAFPGYAGATNPLNFVV